MSHPVELDQYPHNKPEDSPTDEQVMKTLIRKMERFWGQLDKMSLKNPPVRRTRKLFSLRADGGKIEQTRLQELGVGAMVLFGLEPDKKLEPVDSLSLSDGGSIETSIYQSSCIKGLQFICQLRQDAHSRIISATWFLRNWTP